MDLWEIRQYWDKVEMERNQRREKQQAEEDARKNLEAKRTALLRRQAEQMIKQQQQQNRKGQKTGRIVADVQRLTPKVDSKLTIRPVIPGTPTIVSRPVTITPTKPTPSPSYVSVPGKPGILVQRAVTQGQTVLLQSFQQQYSGTQPSPVQKVYNASTPLQVPVSVARPLPLGGCISKSSIYDNDGANSSASFMVVIVMIMMDDDL